MDLNVQKCALLCPYCKHEFEVPLKDITLDHSYECGFCSVDFKAELFIHSISYKLEETEIEPFKKSYCF